MARRVGIAQATQDALRAAATKGTPVGRTKAQGITIMVANNKKLTLLKADGTATANGRFYYKALDLPLPTAYAYEQPLINDKYVNGWDGKKILVRRRDTQGNWVPTENGKNYFKFLRDEFLVTVPSARPTRSADGFILESLSPHTLSEQYFSVPYLRNQKTRKAMMFMDDAERLKLVKEKAETYLRSLPTLNVGGVEYHIIFQDSTPVVWSENGDMTYSLQSIKYENGNEPTTETVLNRPLLDYCLPEGSWRPYELHQNSFRKFEVGCVVQMVFDCFVVKKKASGAARRAGFPNYTTSQGATIRDIEEDFDLIFDELGYKNGEYPFEHSWRRCGATPQMVLAYAKKHALRCFVHFKDNVVASYTPPECGSFTPSLNFSIFANHCYFYGPTAAGEKAYANHASSVKTTKAEQALDCFSDKHLNRIFNTAPPSSYKEWGEMVTLKRCLEENGEGLRYSGGGTQRRSPRTPRHTT